MHIQNCTIQDIETIFELYSHARAYQTEKKVIVWPSIDRALVETEITENRQWKIIQDNQIVCVWATTFSDPLIWEERNIDPAVYIHRIAIHANYRGNNYVAKIVEWAKKYAQKNQKKFVRLDTIIWNNPRLIHYYVSQGFTFLGDFKLKNTEGLPGHYKDATASLFEMIANP
jgi:ribosomal protein S18 acetylase RimI-like enzyme